MSSNFTKPAEDVGKAASEYIDLKIDDLKLRAAKGLSLTVGRLLSMILVLSFVSVVLMALAFGGVLLLGDIINSYGLACFIIAVFYAIIAIVLWLLRKKLFVNGFVSLFVKLFFDNGSEDRSDEGCGIDE